MNKYTAHFLWVLLILVSGCSFKSSGPARLQILSMMPGSEATVSVTSADRGSTGQSMDVSYARPSGYREFSAGRYSVTYQVEGQTLLKHPFVLGKNSSQTLMIAGMRPDSIRTNPQTNWFKARKIVAGSESHDPNGYLPQFIMLRDHWEGNTKKGLIRLVNASPFAKTIRVKYGNKTLLSALKYPKYGEPMKVKSGMHPVDFFLGKIQLDRFKLPVEKGYLHTVIAGNPTSGNSLLKVVTYRTATKALKK